MVMILEKQAILNIVWGLVTGNHCRISSLLNTTFCRDAMLPKLERLDPAHVQWHLLKQGLDLSVIAHLAHPALEDVDDLVQIVVCTQALLACLKSAIKHSTTTKNECGASVMSSTWRANNICMPLWGLWLTKDKRDKTNNFNVVSNHMKPLSMFESELLHARSDQ